MVILKSTRSIRSIKSTRSSKSGFSKSVRDEKKGENAMQSLDNILVVACAKYHCPYAVTVKKEVKQEDYYKSLKQSEQKIRPKRMSLMSKFKSPQELTPESASSTSVAATSSVCLNTISVTLLYDIYNTLTEILFTNIKIIPRILLRVLRFLLPYYKNVTKITMSKCCINMYTIYELKKILSTSTITDICLDGSSLPGADYSMLLGTTNLRNISLGRCNIHDDTCKLLAEKLHYMAPAENLLLINLSSNHITDEGAKHVANALRTNRHLRYLNLADNHITDCGAAHILNVLIEFPLTHDEITDMRRRRLNYLKCKNDLYAKYLHDSGNKSFDEFSQISRKSTTRRKKTSATTLRPKGSARKDKGTSETADYIKTKAEMMSAEIMGSFKDPFHPSIVKVIDGYTYCLGNLVLSCLNLAYNNLSYMTAKKLQNVISYQNVTRGVHEGLMKVVLDGNNLPVACEELSYVDEMLAKYLSKFKVRSEFLRRKSLK